MTHLLFGLWQDSGMAEPCFTKKGSNPPACGVHNVPLRQLKTSQDIRLLGEFSFLMCPVSGQVVNDPATQP
jgi:hypothetical protein